jgi:secreted Zn-dependent insulinase-like peptidase
MLTKAGWGAFLFLMLLTRLKSHQYNARYSIENYDSVIATVHEYVEILRNSPLPEWHHEESRRIAETGFRFQEKGSPDGYVTRLSEALRKPYERDEILIGNRVRTMSSNCRRAQHSLSVTIIFLGSVGILGSPYQVSSRIYDSFQSSCHANG